MYAAVRYGVWVIQYLLYSVFAHRSWMLLSSGHRKPCQYVCLEVVIGRNPGFGEQPASASKVDARAALDCVCSATLAGNARTIATSGCAKHGVQLGKGATCAL